MNKTFDGYLILNWKTNGMKVLRRKKRGNPFDIAIHFRIDVELPKSKEHEVKGKIIVPEEQVAEMVFEELKET